MHTPEKGLISSIGFLAMTARATGAARVAGIDQRDWNAGECSFVLDKRAQLIERPAGVLGAVLPPNRCPRSDVRQVFQRNTSLRVFSGSDDLLTDAVVLVASKAGLSAGQIPQSFLGASRSFALEASPVPMVASPHTFDCCSAVRRTVAVGCQVDDTQVNAEKIGRSDRGTVRNHDTRVQIELPVSEDEIALSFQAVESRPLILAEHQRNELSAIQGQQAYGVHAFEGHQPLVKRDCAVRSKFRTDGLVSREAFDGLSDGAHSHLARQTESFPQFVVDEFVNARLTAYASLKACPSRISGRSVEGAHRGPQLRRLNNCRQKPQLQRQYQGLQCRIDSIRNQSRRAL